VGISFLESHQYKNEVFFLLHSDYFYFIW
jgi:hypothetical protein